MKRIAQIIIAIIGISLCQIAKAQDTVVMKNGDTISVKVFKIDGNNVYYKYQGEDLEYQIPKSQINEIKYRNGRKETFNTVSKSVEKAESEILDFVESAAKAKVEAVEAAMAIVNALAEAAVSNAETMTETKIQAQAAAEAAMAEAGKALEKAKIEIEIAIKEAEIAAGEARAKAEAKAKEESKAKGENNL